MRRARTLIRRCRCRVVPLSLAIASLVAAPDLHAQATGLRDSAVTQAIADTGAADVIVLLRGSPAITAPGLAATSAKFALRLRQDAVLRNLGDSVTLRHRYSRLSGFAGRIDADGFEALLADPDVERVYFDGKVHATLVEGRALSRVGSVLRTGLDGSGVTVAIVDSGIDYENLNLGGCFGRDCKVVAGFDFFSGDPDPYDEHSHGTAVAGIVAADAGHHDVSRRVLGVAPAAKLAALRVLGRDGSGSFSDVEAALDWIVDHNLDDAVPADEKVKIVNLSLGDCTRHTDPSLLPCTGSALATAIEFLLGENVSVFAAAGNDGFNDAVAFPACVPGVIAVGAVYDASIGSRGFLNCNFQPLCNDPMTGPAEIPCYSNLGSLVSVMAPADSARTTSIGPGGIFQGFGGTSAATPSAAGTAALLLQGFFGLTPAEIALRLQNTTRLAFDSGRSPLAFPIIDGVSQLPLDMDGDGIPLGENYCAGGQSVGCSDNCPVAFNPSQADADGDGIGNVCDNCPGPNGSPWDLDRDGRGNDCDICPRTPDPNQLDSDADGRGDACDNCLAAANSDQRDSDDDGIGDPCDTCTDFDADGVGEPGDPCGTDVCPDDWDPDQGDWDDDRVGDACECIPGYPVPLPAFDLREGPIAVTTGFDASAGFSVGRRGEVAATFLGPNGNEIRYGTPGDIRVLAPGRDPAFDDTGRYLAASSTGNLDGINNPDGSSEIFLWRRTVDGTLRDVKQLTTSQGCYNWAPDISRAGSTLVYVSNCDPRGQNPDGNQELFLLDVKTGRIFQLTQTQECTNGPLAPGLLTGPSLHRRSGRHFVAFQSSCSLDPADPDPSGTFSVYLYDFLLSSLSSDVPHDVRVTRLPHCDTCTSSYNPRVWRSSIAYWSAEGSTSPLGISTETVFLRWAQIDTRAFPKNDSTEFCEALLGSPEDPRPISPAIADKYLLYPGVSRSLGPNAELVPQIFLSERGRSAGATGALTEFSEQSGGHALGGQLDRSARFGVFAVTEGGETNLYRVRIR